MPAPALRLLAAALLGGALLIAGGPASAQERIVWTDLELVDGDMVDARTLVASGLIRDNGNPVKLLGDAVLNDVNPRTSWRASADFRKQIISETARRGLKAAIERAGGVF